MVVCVECLRCGQAVGCGVCDTPELWRGAAGLCAGVRACAGAANLYIHHIYMCMCHVTSCVCVCSTGHLPPPLFVVARRSNTHVRGREHTITTHTRAE